MDLVPWSINDLCMQLCDLEALTQFHDLASISLQETHFHSSPALNLHHYAAHCYNVLSGDRAKGGTVVLFKDFIFCAAVSIHFPLEHAVVHFIVRHL
jgi:hypothetical protein